MERSIFKEFQRNMHLKNSYNQNISRLFEANHALKWAEWRELFTPIKQFTSLTVQEAIDSIVSCYELEDEVGL